MQSNCLQAIATSSNQSQLLLGALDWQSRSAEAALASSQIVSSLGIEADPRPACEVSVIVPVRNEAEHLDATLAALAHQTDLQGQPLDPERYEVILLINNCTDESAAIARRFAQRHPQFALHVVERLLPPEEAYVGRVRQLLMDEAYRRLCKLEHSCGIIASTDGDSRVDATWIAAIIHEINRGADAVGGRIVTDSRSRAALHPSARAYYLRSVGYHHLLTELECFLDPDPFDCFPRHHQFFGANFAVTAECYARAGGMPLVRTPEDVAFQQALIAAGARFRHSPLVRVTTSARPVGRATVGLASQLMQWQKMGETNQPFLVEPLAALETRLRARHQIRTLWWQTLAGSPPQPSDVAPIAEHLAISEDWLLQELTLLPSLGLLFRRIEHRQQTEAIWSVRWPLVNIESAIADLRLRLYHLRQSREVSHAADRALQFRSAAV